MSNCFLSCALSTKNSRRESVFECWRADPPIDWDQVKSYDDRWKFDREACIASVMGKEVLSKHRKALMLFGELHLMHGQEKSAVSIYERDHPNVTFVIVNSELITESTSLPR